MSGGSGNSGFPKGSFTRFVSAGGPPPVIRLKHVRINRGLSQDALSRIARVRRLYINQIERGLRNPTAAELTALGSVLGIAPDALLDELGDQIPVSVPVAVEAHR
jgi:transcriptional regulator with XRE-family HTH domain